MADFRDHQDVDVERSHPHRRDADGASTAQHDRGLGLASRLGNEHVTQVVRGVQRAGATGAQELDESVARAIEERRGRGQPLDGGVRDEMEGALGHDLSDVRVHTDADAHDLNNAVSARAFTTGNDVFFKQGTYDPGSSSGKQLLAHELTHVVQQREGTSGLAAGEVSHPSDAAEQHAEAVGQQVAAAPDTPVVARQPEEEEEELQMSREPGVARQPAEEEEELQMSREPGVG